MSPISNPARMLGRQAPASKPRRALRDGPSDPLEPIGPERLRALRKAIREGTYPTEADVLGGLERLFDVD